jgi:hypothetical protein
MTSEFRQNTEVTEQVCRGSNQLYPVLVLVVPVLVFSSRISSITTIALAYHAMNLNEMHPAVVVLPVLLF